MQKCTWLRLVIVIPMMCGINFAYAATKNYIVQYDEKASTVKGPSLKKATPMIGSTTGFHRNQTGG